MNRIVRRLTAADAAAYRDIRLEALLAEPSNFGSDHAHELAFTEAEWARRAAVPGTYGVFDADRLIGIATLRGEELAKTRHRAHVNGVYVIPATRGTGASTALFEAMIAEARGLFLQLHLVVSVHNERARRFYERFGFVVYGTDPRGLNVDGRYTDDYLMVLRLDEGSRKVTDSE